MVRPSGGSSAGKKRAPAAKKTRAPAAAGKKKSKDGKTKTRQRVSDMQIRRQLKAVKELKRRLKEVVGRFEEAYPDGLDFAPNVNDADFA